MPIQIVLVEPEIPQNTGNIVRTCAATGAVLHLVKPLGFSISDKALKRAGLDYWQDADIRVWETLDDFLAQNFGASMYLVTTKAKTFYSEPDYPDNAFLLFGKETAGLPASLLEGAGGMGGRVAGMGAVEGAGAVESDLKGDDNENDKSASKTASANTSKTTSANNKTCIRIPMQTDKRSLNLSNAVSIVLYEVLRKQGFEGLS